MHIKRLLFTLVLIVSISNGCQGAEKTITTIADIPHWSCDVMQALLRSQEEPKAHEWSLSKRSAGYQKENIILAKELGKCVLKEMPNSADITHPTLVLNVLSNTLTIAGDDLKSLALANQSKYEKLLARLQKGWWVTHAANHPDAITKAPGTNYQFLIKREDGAINAYLLNLIAQKLAIDLVADDAWKFKKSNRKSITKKSSLYCYIKNENYNEAIEKLGLQVQKIN